MLVIYYSMSSYILSSVITIHKTQKILENPRKSFKAQGDKSRGVPKLIKNIDTIQGSPWSNMK